MKSTQPEQSIEKHVCMPHDAELLLKWIKTRGGLALWRSVNLSNPGKTWTTPVKAPDGSPMPKQSWEMANEPYRIITDPAEVEVHVPKEVKRFHVGVRMGSQGFTIKVTDGGTRRIRREVAKAKEKYGDAWYEFDYVTQDAVIMVPDVKIPLEEFVAKLG